MAKAKSKTLSSSVPVPQTPDEAAEFVARIGLIKREVLRREADLNDTLAKIKQQVEEALTPDREEADRLTQGLMTWANANRRLLTGDDRTKTIKLGTGEVKWRLRPAKVTIRGVETVIETIKAMGFTKLFLRQTFEINKEAMLAQKDKARTIPGVSIGSDGEDFVVEPFEVELQGVL